MMSMTMDCLICHVILIVTLTKSCIGRGSNIDSDYYYGNMVVRAGRVVIECENRNKQYCFLKCGNLDYECINNKCVCVKAYRSSTSRLEMHVSKKKSVEKYKSANMYGWNAEMQNAETFEQPILRHHIAHFCPNLDKARQCIRKCMALGKPAFCGKDHVCYCSHKQKNPANNLINATDVYTQFKDMYIKYFGPGIFQAKPTTQKPTEKDEDKKETDPEEEKDEKEDKGGKDGEKPKEDNSKEKEGETGGDEGEKHGTEDGKDAKEGEETADKTGGEDATDDAETTTEAADGEGGRRRIVILEY